MLHLVQELGPAATALQMNAIAAGFQASVAEVLAGKTATATRQYEVRGVALCGGVAANTAVREALRTALPPDLPLHVPPTWLCTDNAAMIAAAGFYRRESAVPPAASDDVQPGLGLPLTSPDSVPARIS